MATLIYMHTALSVVPRIFFIIMGCLAMELLPNLYGIIYLNVLQKQQSSRIDSHYCSVVRTSLQVADPNR